MTMRQVYDDEASIYISTSRQAVIPQAVRRKCRRPVRLNPFCLYLSVCLSVASSTHATLHECPLINIVAKT